MKKIIFPILFIITFLIYLSLCITFSEVPYLEWENNAFEFKDNLTNQINTSKIIIVIFPPTIYLEEYEEEESKEIFNLIKNFYKENNISIIRDPKYYFYNQSLFYDTDYHLNEEGRKVNTIKIINKIKNE